MNRPAQHVLFRFEKQLFPVLRQKNFRVLATEKSSGKRFAAAWGSLLSHQRTTGEEHAN